MPYYSVSSAAVSSPLDFCRKTAKAFFSAGGMGTPIMPRFSTILMPSFAQKKRITAVRVTPAVPASKSTLYATRTTSKIAPLRKRPLILALLSKVPSALFGL